MSGYAASPETRRLTLKKNFVLESGAVLDELVVAFRSWGRLSPAADNAVIVCHALTGSADADQWWAPLFGPGAALDPAQDFIVCANVLGGCYGSSGPCSGNASGAAWGGEFPRITIRDQVRAHMALADALGIRGIRLVIGGSMGGLAALEWAVLDPRVEAIASIAASASHSAWCIAWSEAQRLALRADPKFMSGNYSAASPPVDGLAAARAIAMVSYRSPRSLAARYGRASGAQVFGERAKRPDDPAVSGWLSHHGDLLNQRFDANSYLRLLDAMDTHDIGKNRGGQKAALAAIRQPVLVVSIPSDALYVPDDQQALAEVLPNAQLAVLDSVHGHDGFLMDAAALEPIVRNFRHQVTAPSSSRRVGNGARP